MNKFARAMALTLSLCVVPATYGAEMASPHTADISLDGITHANSAIQITPYLWAAKLQGRISPFRRGPTIGVDKPFSEVLDNLNFGGFIDLWGRHDRYVLSGDVAYVDTTEGHASGPLPAIGPLPPGASLAGEIDSQLFIATLLGGYRVVDASDFTLDALGGARFWHVSNKVKIKAPGLSRRYSENFGWAEPVIGARAFIRMSDALSLQAQANIGGFGVGSNFSWSALATLNYIITDNLSVSAGYKVLDVDYDHGGHVYDTRLSGPVLGATWRF